MVSRPAATAEQLSDLHPSKKLAIYFVKKHEKACGVSSRDQFFGHAHDSLIVLKKVLSGALKEAKRGTKEFRAVINDGMQSMSRTVFSHCVVNWLSADH